MKPSRMPSRQPFYRPTPPPTVPPICPSLPFLPFPSLPFPSLPFPSTTSTTLTPVRNPTPLRSRSRSRSRSQSPRDHKALGESVASTKQASHRALAQARLFTFPTAEPSAEPSTHKETHSPRAHLAAANKIPISSAEIHSFCEPNHKAQSAAMVMSWWRPSSQPR
jgi:hypothetical protein